MRPSLFIDGSIFLWQRHGGVNRIYEELMRRLPAKGIPVFAQLPPSAELPLPRRRRYDFPPLLAWSFIVNVKGYTPWDAVSFINFTRSKASAHMGSYYDPVPPGCRLAVVVVFDTIYEMGLVSQGAEPTLRRKRRAIRAADRLIAISHQTRKDLLHFYPEVDPGRVSVQHLAADPAFTPGGAADPFAEPYLLFVGKRGYYKNFRQLLTAYLGSERLRQAFLLKVVSGDAWTPEEKALLSQAPGRVQLLRATDDRALIALYRGATAFVYPSLYEGFGIPLLEAMGCGTPVVCCPRSSLPEVGGDAVAYFEPDQAGDLTRVLEAVCFDRSLRKRLSAAGIARAATFHWDQFAEHVADLLRER